MTVPASPDPSAASGSGPIVVKFIARGKFDPDVIRWLRQFPGRNPVWGRCRFEFDPELRTYDWLVVYDDLPFKKVGKRFVGRSEKLACPPQNTLLITSEPSSVKLYGASFLKQFGVILTSQEPWLIRQTRAVHSQAGLRWYYGISKTSVRDFDEMAAAPPPEKTGLISTVCSSKQQRHTLHQSRYEFVQWLKARLPELDVFGHGVRFIDDKADAVDPYRCHIAIENHVNPHHWTEKLADCYLGWSLPIYHGCPNAVDYFPAESFVAIDIAKPEEAEAIIRDAIREGEYERRLPAIREARRRVLEEYNLFAVVSRLIESRPPAGTAGGENWLHSRHAIRRARLLLPVVELAWEKLRRRWLSRAGKEP